MERRVIVFDRGVFKMQIANVLLWSKAENQEWGSGALLLCQYPSLVWRPSKECPPSWDSTVTCPACHCSLTLNAQNQYPACILSSTKWLPTANYSGDHGHDLNWPVLHCRRHCDLCVMTYSISPTTSANSEPIVTSLVIWVWDWNRIDGWREWFHFRLGFIVQWLQKQLNKNGLNVDTR